MTRADIDDLAQLHRQKRLRLATTIGKQGWAHIGGDPDTLVEDLIRLARVGVAAGEIAQQRPRRRIGAVIRELEGARP